MPRTPKPKPLDSFQTNISDADALVTYARSFTNQRKRRMRKELRERVGEALRVPQRDQGGLDCLESDDLFVVFKPSGTIGNDAFADNRPLLRQALVAGCAALETYVADKAMEFVGAALRSEKPPSRLLDIPMSIGRWQEIEEQYQRKGWGLRAIVEEHFREISGPAPSQVGLILSSIGVEKWARKLDAQRSVPRGRTVSDLERIAARRNRIAHTGDRYGQGRARLGADEIETELTVIKSVANGIEELLAAHAV